MFCNAFVEEEMKDKIWLCMILERGTDRELASYEDVVAMDAYWAKSRAMDRYVADNPDIERNSLRADAVPV
jgi:hypothetical protein